MPDAGALCGVVEGCDCVAQVVDVLAVEDGQVEGEEADEEEVFIGHV